MRSTIRLLIAAVIVGRGAAAGELTTEGATSALESPRALNGHIFQPAGLLSGPFAPTSVGSTTEFGIFEATAPRFDLHGKQIGIRTLDMGGFGQTISAEIGLWKGIGLRLQASGLVFSGTNGVSVLSGGVTAQYGFSGGLVAGGNLSPNTRLSFVGDIGPQPELSLLVGNAVLRAIQTSSFQADGLVSNVDRLRGAPGLSFAWAPSPAVGVVGEGRYVWLRRITNDSSQLVSQGFSVGGAAELDLEPLVRWPFAFQGVFLAEVPVGGKGIPQVQQAGVGFFYSARVRLALGLQLLWRHGDIRPGVDPRLSSTGGIAAIHLNYYW